jgi:hypothetical protein
MKQITTSKGSYIFVEESLFDSQWYNLPDGKYILLCTTDTITKDIAKGIVDKVGAFYMDYISKIPDLEDALFSFATLITSEQNNLSPSKTYAICKQNTI